MAMPKTAMDEDDRSVFRQHKVWPTSDIFRMQPEAEATRMQSPPKYQFGLCVLSLDPCHQSRTGLFVDNVRHLAPGLRYEN